MGTHRQTCRGGNWLVRSPRQGRGTCAALMSTFSSPAVLRPGTAYGLGGGFGRPAYRAGSLPLNYEEMVLARCLCRSGTRPADSALLDSFLDSRNGLLHGVFEHGFAHFHDLGTDAVDERAK